MKRMKKLASLLLAMVMVFSMTATVFAAGSSGTATGFSITVTNSRDNISMEGQTYTAYKLFDVTYNESGAYSYKIAAGFEGFVYPGASGQNLVDYVADLTVKNDGEDKDSPEEAARKRTELDRLATAALEYAEANEESIAHNSATAERDADRVTIDLSAQGAGYYLVAGNVTADSDDPSGKQTVTAACILTTTDPTAEVHVKADAPSITKKIVTLDAQGQPTDGREDTNNASVGKDVMYELKSKVPNMEGYEKYFFIINDTMTGLDFKQIDSVTIGAKTISVTEDKTSEGETYYYETDGTDTTPARNIKIVFNNFIQYKEMAGADIIIHYTATVAEDANIGTVGNPNEVDLTYSNNPNETSNGKPGSPDEPDDDDPTGVTPKDFVVTYVTGIELTKVDANNQTVKLANAKFKITGESVTKVWTKAENFTSNANGDYYKLTDGKYTMVRPSEDGENEAYVKLDDGSYDRYVRTLDEGWTTKTDTVEVIGVTDANGLLDFTGLGAGTYTITEEEAPDGYNKLTDPIVVTISFDGTEPATITTGTEKAKWSATQAVNGENVPLTVKGGDDPEAGVVTITVGNNKGALLPSTGGIGTTIFYAAGIILMAGAVFFVIRRRRA